MNKQIKNLQPITYNVQLQKHQNEVFLGVISVFPTTNNQQLTTRFQQLTTRFQQLTTKRIYDSQLGTREQDINAGAQIEEYLRYVNLGRGQPWCAAFICWVYGQAGVDNPRSGWTPDLFPVSKLIWSKVGSRPGESGTKSQESRHPQSVTYDYSTRQTTGNRQLTTPGTGDIFALFFPEKNRIAHAGFIDQWDGTWLITVEGNTNQSGSREGDGVYRKRRLVKSIYRVARYITESKPIQKTGYE